MVEAFPGRGAERDIAHKTNRAIIETFTDIDDATARMCQGQVGTLDGWVVNIFQTNEGRSAAETGVVAEPFVSLTVKVEAVGSEGVTKKAKRTTFGVISADGPECLVLVSFVSAEVDDAPGTEDIVNGTKHDVVAKGGITDHVGDVKTGIEAGELE